MHHPLGHIPEFEELAEALAAVASISSACEVQGLLTGLLAGGGRVSKSALRKMLEAHLEIGEPLPDPLAENLWVLSQQIQSLLADPELGYQLMLPDDDEPLTSRVQALGEWCDGFLIGFGTAARPDAESVQSESVRGALADIVEIANVDSGAEEGSDADESAYMELVEYVRMAAVMLFTEMAPREERTQEDHPSVH